MQDSANHVGGFDIMQIDQRVGEIRSHIWSPRYEKWLAIAMLDLSFLNDNSSITINGQDSQFHPIPFDTQNLSA